MVIESINYVFDSSNFTFRSIATGTGRLHTCAAIALIAYVVGHSIGTPLVFFTSFAIKGFWVAMTVTFIIQMAGYTGFFVIIDWENEAEKAKIRVRVKDSNDYETIDSSEETKETNSLTPGLTKLKDWMISIIPCSRCCSDLTWCIFYSTLCISLFAVGVSIQVLS